MQELVKKIAQVSEAVGFQAGAGGVEIAGQIVSCLAARPELIERFMEEGTELLIDGSIRLENGVLTFEDREGGISTPQDLRMAIQVKQMEKRAQQ